MITGKQEDEVCRFVKLQTFKGIYGHGSNVKFVKLLFLLLKKQIDRFIEQKNATTKNQRTANLGKKVQEVNEIDHVVRKELHKKGSSMSNGSFGKSLSPFDKYKKPQRHALCHDLEESRKRAQRLNQEHNFYKSALACQNPQNQPKIIAGFKVSQAKRM